MIPLADGRVAVVSAQLARPPRRLHTADDTWSHGATCRGRPSALRRRSAWSRSGKTPTTRRCTACRPTPTAQPSRGMLVKSTDGLATWSTVAQTAWSGGTVLDKVKRARWYRLASGTHVLLIGAAGAGVAVDQWRRLALVGSLTGIQPTACTWSSTCTCCRMVACSRCTARRIRCRSAAGCAT